MIFFTSDTHFGQERTFINSKRPFSSLRESDDKLIENWNKKILPGDKVYHLGDFGNFETVKKLNGEIVLVCGNYETNLLKSMGEDLNKFTTFLINKGFYDVVIKDIWINNVINEKNVHLSHSPDCLDKSCLNLFGHVHGSFAFNKFGINVGVDVRNFEPLSEPELIQLAIFTKQKNNEKSM